VGDGAIDREGACIEAGGTGEVGICSKIEGGAAGFCEIDACIVFGEWGAQCKSSGAIAGDDEVVIGLDFGVDGGCAASLV
jgi:hypothetical protein